MADFVPIFAIQAMQFLYYFKMKDREGLEDDLQVQFEHDELLDDVEKEYTTEEKK